MAYSAQSDPYNTHSVDPSASSSPTSPDSLSSPTSLLSPSFGRSAMLRARPRLPAGPRTRKQPPLSADSSKQHEQSLQRPSASPEPAPAWSARGSDTPPTEASSRPSVPLLSTPVAPSSDPQSPSLPTAPPIFAPQSLAATGGSHVPRTESPTAAVSPARSHLSYDDRYTPSSSRPVTPAPAPPPPPALMPTPTPPRKPSQATLNSTTTTTTTTTTTPLVLPSAQLVLAPEPLPYKHLTLDAAHWTLSSAELQTLVSGAIRESAKEHFIRLLPPAALDTQIPADAARTERAWDAAAARWRFEAQRRAMLLRALAAAGADADLLAQLAGTLAQLDAHAQALLHAAAHRAELAAARDTHRASALAVALRKLNASYARRTRELDKARTQIAALRGELDDAWKVAEEQAAEVDRLKAAAAASPPAAPAPAPPAAAAAPPHDDAVSDDGDGDYVDEDDVTSSVLPDGASADLHTLSRAEVVDVTGTAVVARRA
ncbi:hypothetical protein BC834DRAFT_1043490 [Gloeopeniophorella convolvens]|nr:hypothetical protein BC834DRAFT_1043490 [Gloeopeniophorella convolvens]